MSDAKIGNKLTAPPKSTANRSSEIDPSNNRVPTTYRNPSSIVLNVNPFFSAAPRGFTIATSTRNTRMHTHVNTYTSGAPCSHRILPVSAIVNSSPPIIGPSAFDTWNTLAPHVTAFTKCSFGTSVGTSAEAAGPEKHRPSPITNSTE